NKTYDFIPFEMLRKQWQTVVLKLIRRTLNEQVNKQVQSRLQKAYSENGVYSRRIKSLCKKLVSEWQKAATRWIVKAKRMLKRRTWSERKGEYALWMGNYR